MYDSFNREINYLRISVTDRCNLRCIYCMPEKGVTLLHHEDILRYEEITKIATVAINMGIRKIRITGGEPLSRKGVTSLVQMLANIPGLEDLAMTTNGVLLPEFATALKQNGLMRINISLDTVNPQKFFEMTRGGNIEDVFGGIRASQTAGLFPIKLNCVVAHSSEEPDANEVRQFASVQGLEVRFIHQMDLKNGHFSTVEGGDGGNCSSCNRLRLTADGKLKPCLFSDMVFDVKKLGAAEAIARAISKKPASGTQNCSGHFYNIGG
ncbi:MAG: radical SAM protein [Bacteroidetes bacterium]|nr:radical SAM protein [Bacteroidota bacterium]